VFQLFIDMNLTTASTEHIEERVFSYIMGHIIWF